MTEVSSPFDALEDAAGIQFDLAEDKAVDERLITLGYHCAGWHFLVQHGVTAEVLPLPVLNIVPRAPAYCWGICNVRGNIVPVFDLADYLTGQTEFKGHGKLYVLLMGKGADQVAIVIDQIPKSMQFVSSQRVSQSSHVPDRVREHVHGVYQQDEIIWHELDISGLFRANQ